MGLRARKLVEYFCARCGYSTTIKPLSDVCPACSDGEPRQWSMSDKDNPDNPYETPIQIWIS